MQYIYVSMYFVCTQKYYNSMQSRLLNKQKMINALKQAK